MNSLLDNCTTCIVVCVDCNNLHCRVAQLSWGGVDALIYVITELRRSEGVTLIFLCSIGSPLTHVVLGCVDTFDQVQDCLFSVFDDLKVFSLFSFSKLASYCCHPFWDLLSPRSSA